MKKIKLNKYNFPEFEKIRKLIKKFFPQKMSLGFYIKDFKDSSIVNNPKLKEIAVSGVVEIRGDMENLRIYRYADSGEHKYDVDEIGGINKALKEVKKPQEIRNHHLNKSIPEDIVSANNLTLEVVENKDGTFRLNTDNRGVVRAFINFPDPEEKFMDKNNVGKQPN